MSTLLYCQITYLCQRSTISTSMTILISATRSFIRFMTPLLEVTPESLTHGVLLIADTKDPVYTNSSKAMSKNAPNVRNLKSSHTQNVPHYITLIPIWNKDRSNMYSMDHMRLRNKYHLSPTASNFPHR